MLSLAKAAKDYYLQKLGKISPREDYYLRGGTATGRWVGSGAAELDLNGTVTAQGLVRLFDGEHPVTGEQLGRRLRKDGVAAWDVTFSADKSVSLLWALGDEQTRKEVVEAFEEATTQGLGYLQSVASATRGASKTPVLDDQGRPVRDEKGRRKHRVATWPLRSLGYVGAAFTEYTSRADDPQLHTHVVIANKVRGEDGKWRTIDGRLLYRHQLAAGYLHEAVLRKELTERLGVRWQPVHNGIADIEGFRRDQIEAFSRRRDQLETWRLEQGLADTPAARQKAVVATRGPKRDHPLEELEVEWHQRAVEVGLTPELIAQILDRDRRITLVDPGELAQRMISSEGLTAKTSTFGRSEVIRAIAASLPEGGSRTEIEAVADTILQHSDMVVTLPVRDDDTPEELGQTLENPKPVMTLRHRDGRPFPGVTGEHRYTTAELLTTEQRIITRALHGDNHRWRVPHRLVEAVLRRHRELTKEQAEMVYRFAISGRSIEVGVGPAGSGKTTVMALLAQLAAITGTPILGTALAARAATGLQSATGIPSSSLTALRHQITNGGGLPHGAIVVVDEASMVSTRQLAALSDQVEEARGKLILIGDDHQLPELEAGGLFHALARRLSAVKLSENIRQHEPWEREALTQLRDGSVAGAVEAYRQHRRLFVGPNREETIGRATRDWCQHVTTTGDFTSGILISYDNQTVTELNEQARSLLAASGQLHGPTLEVGEDVFQAGDRILCRKNQYRLDLLNGDLGTVIEVDPERKRITVRLDRDPEVRELPAWYLIVGLLDYGYALTGHKAQGITCNRTFTVITGTTHREWAYVALSRGREANTLYLTTPSPDQPCAHLTHITGGPEDDEISRLLDRSSVQTAAIDHHPRERTSSGRGSETIEPPAPGDEEMERVLRSIAYHRAQRRQLEQRKQSMGLEIGR